MGSSGSLARNERNSMPMFAGSSSHSGLLASNNSQDMTFVMGLSENLLVECRRLQADNENKKRKLQTVRQDYEEMKDKHHKMSNTHQATVKELQSLRDLNWELEEKLQSLTVDSKRLKEKLSQNNRDLSQKTESLKDSKTDLEVARRKFEQLEGHMEVVKTGYLAQVDGLKTDIRQLNDEHDELYTKNKELQFKIEELQSTNKELQFKDEELQSTNKELQFKNDELQSTNKELQFTNDELQSTNKELQFKNDELQSKSKELQLTNEEYQSKSKELQLTNEEFQSTNEELQLTNDEFQSTNQELHFKNGELQSTNKELQEELKKREEVESTITDALRSKENDLKGANHAIAQLNEKINQINAERESSGERVQTQSTDDPNLQVKEAKLITEIEKSGEVLPPVTSSSNDLEGVNSSSSTSFEQTDAHNDLGSNEIALKKEENIENVKARLRNSGYAVVLATEYDELLTKLESFDNPTTEYLESKAKALDKQLISSEELKQISNPPIAQTINKLERDGYKVLEEGTHLDLLRRTENPSLDYLREKLEILHYVAVTDQEIKRLREPDLSLVTENAKNIGFAVVAEGLYSQMQKDTSEPSLDYLKEIVQKGDTNELLNWLANKRHAILVDQKELQKLKSCYNAPSKDFLDDKAMSLGYSLIQCDELSDMVQKVENPSIDYLKLKADARSLSVLPSNELTELMKVHEAPDFEFLAKAANKIGYCLVKSEEFEDLQLTSQSPTLEFLKSKANEKDHTIIDNNSYHDLTQHSMHPNLEFLQEKASNQGLLLTDRITYEDMQRKISQPKQHELAEMASKLGYCVVPALEYEQTKTNLNKPTCEYLREKAKEHDMSLISTDELAELKKTTKDKSKVLTAVKSFGFIPIPLPQLQALESSSLAAASLSALKTRIQDLGYIAIAKQEFERYQSANKISDTKEGAITLCSKYGLVALPHDDFESLRRDSALSLEEHVSALRSHGYAVLTQSDYDELESQLDLSVPDPQTKEKQNSSGELNQGINVTGSGSIRTLQEKASASGFVIVRKVKYDELQSYLDSPPLNYLESKAKLSGLVLTDAEEIEANKRQIQSPDFAHLSSKAEGLGYELISQERLKELERKVSCPSRQELDKFVSEKELMLLSKDEYHETRNRLENPTVQELQAKLREVGYITIPISEYNSLQHDLVSPSEAYLTQKGIIYGKILVEKSSYEALQLNLSKPSEHYLTEHAASLGKTLVSESTYNKNLEMIAAPTQDFLEQKAKDYGLLLISVKEMESYKTLLKFQNMLEKAGLELSTTEENDLLLNHLQVATEQEDEFDSSDSVKPEDNGLSGVVGKSSVITKTLKSGAFVLLDKEAYQSLLRACIKKVTKREVINICSEFNMIAVPSEKYDELSKEPSLDDIQSYASRHASVVVLREQLDMLKAQVECPSEDTIQRSVEQKGLMLVKKSEYDSVTLKLNSPTKLELERQAEKLGMIAIPSERYECLLKEVENKSPSATPSPSSKVLASKQYFEQVIRNQNKQSDKLYGPTKTLGFVTLSNEEYRKLKDNQKSHTFTKTDVYNGAKAFSLAVLPLEEYKALLKRKLVKEPFDYEDLEDSTARFDMKLNALHLDSPTPCRRKSVDSDKGNSLKFHDLSSVATSESFYSADDNFSDRETAKLDRHELQPNIAVSAANYGALATDMPDNHSDEVLTSPASVASTICPQGDIVGHCSEDIKLEANASGTKVNSLPHEDKSMQQDKPMHQHQHNAPELMDSTESPVDTDLEECSDLDEEVLIKEADKKDLVLLPRADYEKYLAVTTSDITKEMLEAEASKLGMVVLEKEQYNELLGKIEVDAGRIEDLAPQFGLKAVSQDYLNQLEAQVANEQLTADNIKAKVATLGYVALTISEFKALGEKARTERPKDEQESPELAISSSSSVVNPDIKEARKVPEVEEPDSNAGDVDETALASTPLTTEDRDLNQTSLNNNEEVDGKEMPANVSVDDIVRWASEFKLVPIEMEQFEQIKEELSNPVLSIDEIEEQARKHHLVILPEDVYEQMKNSSKGGEQMEKPESQTAELTNTVNVGWDKNITFDVAIAHLRVIADRFNLFRSPEEASQAFTPSDARRVVVLSEVYYDELLEKQKMLGIKLAEDRIRTKDERIALKMNANKPKTHQLPQPPIIGSPKAERKTSVGSPKSPAQSAAAYAQKAHFRVPKSASHGGTFMGKPSRSSSVARNDSIAESSIRRSDSVGALSLATVASLSEPSIIPALTQTVIGEYLHKYYPYFGPFGLNSRHQRFFWVHPYTLTLYWSTTNPVLSNPSNHKTKCAAILAVESVVDTNPYPAGLYHKSIVVTSENKTVKITCATRQRHNIWYNSLRYLVQRNMQGINLEAIADDPSDIMYSGKIFPLPGENSKSASQRLSSSRRSVRARMPKSTSMPINER